MQLFGFTHSLKRYHHYSSDCWIILILSDTNLLYCRGCLLVRQSFFHDDPSTWTDVGGGVLGCRGFHSSFRTTQSGLSLNIGKSSYTRSHMFGFTNDLIDSIISFPSDVSTTMIIQPGPVVDFLIANQNVRDPFSLDWTKVTNG